MAAFDAASFLEQVAVEKVTHTWLVPTQVRILLDSPAMETAENAPVHAAVGVEDDRRDVALGVVQGDEEAGRLEHAAGQVGTVVVEPPA